MKTAMMEHIQWLYEVIDITHEQQMNADIIQAIEYIIEGAKAKLPIEKQQMTSFAKLWEEKLLDGRIDSVDDLYKETYGK